jgi:ribulose-phosphate 3-epimerase
MDHHYVPNLSIGPMVAKAIRPHARRDDGSRVPLDVHLMVEPVDALAQAFAAAGADWISFHPDAVRHVDRSLAAIAGAGCKAGLVYSPGASIEGLEWVLDKVDLVLVMSVNPGFGGQSFIDSALAKIERLRRVIDASGRDIRLEVDGGITAATIRRAADGGRRHLRCRQCRLRRAGPHGGHRRVARGIAERGGGPHLDGMMLPRSLRSLPPEGARRALRAAVQTRP